MTLSETYKHLLNNYYVLYYNSKLVVTNKFYRTFTAIRNEPMDLESRVIVQTKNNANIAKVVNPSYLEFIQQCDLPREIKNGKLIYTVNQYSLKAEKKYNEIVKKYEYNKLVKATSNYYKTNPHPVKITNFIIDAVWLGEYNTNIDTTTRNKYDE